MTHLPRDEEMFDLAFCRGKQAEYAAKAKTATNPSLKLAYEATAREYAYRLTLIGGKSAT